MRLGKSQTTSRYFTTGKAELTRAKGTSLKVSILNSGNTPAEKLVTELTLPANL